MNRVELRALVLTAGRKALGVQSEVAHALGLQRGQHLAGATDELVQLEGEGCATLRRLHVVRGHQEALQPGMRFFHRALRIVSQALGGIAQGHRPGPPGWLIEGQFYAKAQLHPHGQGVVAERGEVRPVVAFFQ